MHLQANAALQASARCAALHYPSARRPPAHLDRHPAAPPQAPVADTMRARPQQRAQHNILHVLQESEPSAPRSRRQMLVNAGPLLGECSRLQSIAPYHPQHNIPHLLRQHKSSATAAQVKLSINCRPATDRSCFFHKKPGSFAVANWAPTHSNRRPAGVGSKNTPPWAVQREAALPVGLLAVARRTPTQSCCFGCPGSAASQRPALAAALPRHCPPSRCRPEQRPPRKSTAVQRPRPPPCQAAPLPRLPPPEWLQSTGPLAAPAAATTARCRCRRCAYARCRCPRPDHQHRPAPPPEGGPAPPPAHSGSGGLPLPQA